jgi:sacsin
VSSIGKSGSGDKDKFNDEKHSSSSSRRSGKATNDSTDFNSDPSFTNGFDHSKTHRQTSADSDSSSNTTSESQSESESAQTNEQDVIDKTELELTKTEIYSAVRQAFQLTGQERKKTVKKLLLKWHPDKNPGRERFAAEVFKHLRKQIDHFENDPLTSFFNTFNNFHHSPFSASDPKFSWNKHSSTTKPNPQNPTSSSTTTDDRFGSFDNLNKDANEDTKRSYQDIPNGNPKDQADNDEMNGNSNKSRFSPHRSSSFRTAREEWQYRRQHGFQRRHGFFSTTEENATNNNTNGTNGQASSSTGGSKLSFCLLFHRHTHFYFSHFEIFLTLNFFKNINRRKSKCTS